MNRQTVALLILFIGFAQTRMFSLADPQANGYYLLLSEKALYLQTWVYFFGEHILLMCIFAAATMSLSDVNYVDAAEHLFEFEFLDLIDYAVFYNDPWFPELTSIEYNDIKLILILVLILNLIWTTKKS